MDTKINHRKKDAPKQKKIYPSSPSTSSQETLHYEFIDLVKAMHPGKRTTNPYQSQLVDLTKNLPLMDAILLSRMIEAITLLNYRFRQQRGTHYESIREDLSIAIEMVLPSSYQLYQLQIESLYQLQDTYPTEPFTYTQAEVVLNCSRSSVKRRLYPLIQRGFIERIGRDSLGKSYLKIVTDPITPIHLESSEDPFSEAMKQWEDYTGYYDAQMRT